MTHLILEWWAALDAPGKDTELERLGVPADWRASVGRARIVPGKAFYSPATADDDLSRTVLAYIIGIVSPDDGAITDLVAFNERRFWQRTGAASVLVSDPTPRVWPPASPLAVWKHPLAWLRSGGQGIVPLNDDAIDYMLEWPAIAAEDEALATRIDSELRASLPLPEIRVRRSARVAA